MRKFLFSVFVAIMVIAPIGLFAQSNTYTSTAGIFKTDVDKALSVTDFSEIDGGIAYALIDNSFLNLGFGNHFGGLYLGAAYMGDIFGYWPWDYQETDTTYILDAVNAIVGTTKESFAGNGDSTRHWNMLNLLVGFGTIGIQPGVYETADVESAKFTLNPYSFNSGSAYISPMTSIINTSSTSSDDVTQTTDASGNVIAATSTTYDDGTYALPSNNVIWPWIGAGMDLSLGGLVLKPSLGFSVGFYNGTSSAGRTHYTRTIGSSLPTYQNIADVSVYNRKAATNASGYTDLNGSLGATLILGSGSPSQMEFSIAYNLESLPLYGNAYTGLDGNAARAAGEVWTYSETDYIASPSTLETTTTTTDVILITTHRSSKHKVAPGFLMRTKASEAFSFGFSFLPTVEFSNSTLATTGSARQTTTYRYNPDSVTYGSDYTAVENKTYVGTTVSASTLTLALPLKAGLQYYMIPSILRLNGGVTVNLPKYSCSVSTTTGSGLSTDEIVQTNADGTTSTSYSDSLGWTRNEYQDASSSINNAALSVSMGGTWFITPAVTLDLLFADNAVGYIPIYEFTVQLNVKL